MFGARMCVYFLFYDTFSGSSIFPSAVLSIRCNWSRLVPCNKIFDLCFLNGNLLFQTNNNSIVFQLFRRMSNEHSKDRLGDI